MKKQFKKITALILGSIMTLSLFACSTEKVPDTPTVTTTTETATTTEVKEEAKALVAEKDATIKFSYWAGSPSDEVAWKVVLETFKKDHPEIVLNAEVFPSSTYNSQLDTLIAGNNWPDVMRYTYQRLGKFKEADVMLDLTDKISKESVADLVPAYRDALTYDGKLVGMPHHTDTVAVFYNKEMFTKSNIRIPKDATDGWSWSELSEIAKKIKADNGLEYSFAGIWENNNAYRFLPFVYMNGGSLLDASGKNLNIETPEFSGAIKLYDDWRKEGLVVPTGFTQPNQANAMLVAKKIGFVFAGSWHCSYMEENMPGNWGVTYMPVVNGKTGSDLGGNSLFAYKDTKYPNASAIFIDYITNKENMKAFSEAGNFIPVRTSLIEEGLVYQKFQEEMNVFLNIVATIDNKMAQDETSAKFQQLNLVLGQELDPLVINSSATVEQVISSLKTKMQEVLDEE